MSYLLGVINFMHEHFYSPYTIALLILTGLVSFILETDYDHFYGYHRDFLVAFFLGILNIAAGVFLLIIHLIHLRLVFYL